METVSSCILTYVHYTFFSALLLGMGGGSSVLNSEDLVDSSVLARGSRCCRHPSEGGTIGIECILILLLASKIARLRDRPKVGVDETPITADPSRVLASNVRALANLLITVFLHIRALVASRLATLAEASINHINVTRRSLGRLLAYVWPQVKVTLEVGGYIQTVLLAALSELLRILVERTVRSFEHVAFQVRRERYTNVSRVTVSSCAVEDLILVE